MSFNGWNSFGDLFEKLAAAFPHWSGAATFEEFDELVRGNCASLVGDEGGYDDLLARLEASGAHGGDRDLLFEHVRTAALAIPAAQYAGLGPEWAGFWISRKLRGEEIYASSRYASPPEWALLEISVQAATLQYDEETGLMYDATQWYLRDGETVVWPHDAQPGAFRDSNGNVYVHGELQAGAAPDLSAQHFDTESGRWRRFLADDNEFEYYHTVDGVWERRREQLWYRLHAGVGRWLPYDEPSRTWLDQGQWRSEEQVGRPETPDAGDEAEPADADEQVYTDIVKGIDDVVNAVRALGISAERVTDEELAALFVHRAEEMLIEEVPEYRELIES